jgi:FMN phosphatase YigB (HAD superfamily)
LLQKLHKNISDYRAIILDLDGTLYYQMPLRLCMAFNLLRYYVLHLNRLHELLRLRDFRKTREHGQLGEAGEVTAYWMQEAPLKYVYRFRDKKLLALMQGLRNKGVKIIVYSDYPAKKKLEALRFEVDYCFCASDPEINCLKPDTKGIKQIIAVVQKPVEQMLFIGDRYEKDGKCAEGVGMEYVILDTWPFLRHIMFFRLYKKELSNAE